MKGGYIMANLEKFIVPFYDKSGIYAIINKTKVKAYIGQSTNIKRRAEQHKTKIASRNHDIKEINEDCNDEFSFLVLHKFYNESISKEKLDLYEKLYMLTLARAGFDLYNKNDTGKRNDINDISWRICTDLLFNIGTEENFKDAYFEKYGKHYSYDVRVKENKRKITL